MSKAFICSRGDISANSHLQTVQTLIADAFPMLRPSHLAQLFSGVPCVLMVGEKEQLAEVVPRFEALGLMVEIVDSASKLRALNFAKLNWLHLLPEVSEIEAESAIDNEPLPLDDLSLPDIAGKTESSDSAATAEAVEEVQVVEAAEAAEANEDAEAPLNDSESSDGVRLELVDHATQASQQSMIDESSDEPSQAFAEFDLSALSLAPLDADESPSDENSSDDNEIK